MVNINLLAQPGHDSDSEESYYGSIKGSVMDESTRSPLMGVNIRVEGTEWGCAAVSPEKVDMVQPYDAFLSKVRKTTFKAAGFGQVKCKRDYQFPAL
ncbi:MAG: hypothetical protein P8078_00385 [bacterium]